MEPSECESTPISSSDKDPELGSVISLRGPDPETPALNHHAEVDSLHEQLQNKLGLKDKEEEREDQNKILNFEGGKEVFDKADAIEESEKLVVGFVEDSWNWNGTESNSWGENENGSENEKVDGDFDIVVDDEVEKEVRNRTYQYPVRPEAQDCAFYLKTGNCKFGSNCKFNHPVRRKNQAVKEKAGERGESLERQPQAECKYYLRSGGCKFGQACKYNHTRGKNSAAPILELNFLGLPIRLGEKECPYYMRNGSCKYGANCKFNHPDPTAAGGCDSPTGYNNGGSIPLQAVPQPSVSSWSSPRTANETAPFVPMMFPPTQGVSLQGTEWNGYQAPVYLPEKNMHPTSTFVVNNPAIETNAYMHHQKQMEVEEFPERPGEPECTYFLKTGYCKFKSNCKFHHPKNPTARPPPCTLRLSDKGLPLRPDKNVCTFYSRYGICKFGPACKFDHPINTLPSPTSRLEPQSSSANSSNVEVSEMAGSAGASDVTI